MIISKECLFCTKKFNAILAEHKRGNAKFCCLKCSSRHYSKNRPKPIPNLTCAICTKQFYRAPSKICSKSGLQFCNRKCKEKAQSVVGGVISIQPSHYGDGHTEYRRRAIQHYGAVCCKCQYEEHEKMLDVDHIDGNRRNGKIENLQVLCIWCHGLKTRKVPEHDRIKAV